jgi:hypothetical protein
MTSSPSRITGGGLGLMNDVEDDEEEDKKMEDEEKVVS